VPHFKKASASPLASPCGEADPCRLLSPFTIQNTGHDDNNKRITSLYLRFHKDCDPRTLLKSNIKYLSLFFCLDYYIFRNKNLLVTHPLAKKPLRSMPSSSAESKMTLAKMVLSRVGSIAATVMLVQTVIHNYIPRELHAYIFFGLKNMFTKFSK